VQAEEVRRVQARSAEAEDASAAAEVPRSRVAALGALVVALVFLIALGSSRSDSRVGGPGRIFHGGGAVGDLDFAFLLLGLLALAVFVLALSAGLRRRPQEDDHVVERPPAPWWEKALIVAVALVPAALVVAVVIVALESSHHGAATKRPAVPPSSSGLTHSPTSPGASHPATPTVHWVAWAVGAAAVVVVLLLVAAARRRSRVTHSSSDDATQPSLAVQAVIQDSLDDLERESDPRRAVIRAYSGMERELARHGAGRRPSEAPLEYLARSLSVMRVSRGAGERLTGLFQRARFSEHTIDETMKREAIGALTAVRDELAEEPAH
jgi:Domain of unknown function (DUF4129)